MNGVMVIGEERTPGPQQANRPGGQASLEMPSKPRVIRNQRILLVDDEKDVRLSLAWLLKLDHHSVTQASCGSEAMELYAPDRFDLVITDMRMPGMTGAALAVQIRDLNPSQPIIMLTALAEVTRGVRNPVDDILHKPVWLAELRESIRRSVKGEALPL